MNLAMGEHIDEESGFWTLMTIGKEKKRGSLTTTSREESKFSSSIIFVVCVAVTNF